MSQKIFLLAAFSLIAGQVMAMEPMELPIDNEWATPEETVALTRQNQEVHLATRFIPLLKEITLGVAQNKLTLDEILGLPEAIRNEVIKRKALSLAGPVPAREQSVTDHENAVWSVCVTRDAKIVTGLFEDSSVRVWDMKGNELAVCRGHEDRVTSVVSTDDKIVSGSSDRTVRVWDMNGQELAVCRGHEDAVSSVCVTTDDRIVSGSHDNTVGVWDMNGNELARCIGHECIVTSVCITTDDKIVSGSWDNTVRVWDMNGNELTVCEGHEGLITFVSITQDNKIVSQSSWDRTMRLWAMNGQELKVFKGHEDNVLSVCVTPDSKIVSGSCDGTVRVWDMNGKELAVCRGHTEHVNSVSITTDGNIVSGSVDKTVRIWDISVLHRLTTMNNEQAQAVCILLQSSTYASCEEQERCWQDIGKIFEEEGLIIQNIQRNTSCTTNYS